MKIGTFLREQPAERKLSLLYGKRNWYVGGGEVPEIELRDGPHGLREEGTHCYPNLCLLACSWDRDLFFRVGKSLAGEYIRNEVDVLLGPGINLKRVPTCGRNFEYLSEDPVLTGELAAAMVRGLQQCGVVACVKHFCCYQQEDGRMSGSSEVDETTLRELYLKAFEIVVRKSAPRMLMTSYNRLNGIYTAQHRSLYRILRKEWKYEGVVVSDWGGVDDRVASLKAGLDLEMPGSPDVPEEVRNALRDGKISEKEIDRHCRRILKLIAFAKAPKHPCAEPFSLRQTAAESMVLLKNEGVLPLRREDRIAVVGPYAKAPRFQGGGCAHVNAESVSVPLDEIRRLGTVVGFADGMGKSGRREAEKLCAGAEKAVVFVGLGEEEESEAYDRKSMKLPEEQAELVRAICSVQPNTVVVLFNGSPVEMQAWAGNAAGILESYYAGEAVGGAVADVLFGIVNPSGRLAESFPIREQDHPAYPFLKYRDGRAVYGEGEFVGYRYYTTVGREVSRPFGYGLSYTEYEYGDLTLSSAKLPAGGEVRVSVPVRNIGRRAGKEVVQLYLRRKERNGRPLVELLDFVKISLEPEEEKTVSFVLHADSFRHFDAGKGTYVPESGVRELCVCRDAETVVRSAELTLCAPEDRPFCNRHTTVGELLKYANGAELCNRYLADAVKICIYGEEDVRIVFEGHDVCGDEFCRNLAKSLPLRALVVLTSGRFTEARLSEVLQKLNEELIPEGGKK